MINIAVEGESDRELAKAIVRSTGHHVGKVRQAGGHTKLDPLIAKYAAAARRETWVVFRDSDGACPVTLRKRLQPEGLNERFSLRIAHSMSEAWLMADRVGFASFFSVAVSRVPAAPDSVSHAKRTLLALCADSRSRAVRSDMVAGDAKVGPLYVSRINEFAASLWNAGEARLASDSLDRALRRIAALPA